MRYFIPNLQSIDTENIFFFPATAFTTCRQCRCGYNRHKVRPIFLHIIGFKYS